MSSPTAQDYADNIGNYVAGLARHPGALQQLQLSLVSMPEQWQKLAMHRLYVRKTALLDALNDAELEAVGTGQVDLWAIAQAVASVQANTVANVPQDAICPDPAILEVIELIAQRKLRHTVCTRNRDSLDFFEVHAASVQDALLTAFMAGMQVKNA
jgi:hypothetical protein